MPNHADTALAGVPDVVALSCCPTSPTTSLWCADRVGDCVGLCHTGVSATGDTANGRRATSAAIPTLAIFLFAHIFVASTLDSWTTVERPPLGGGHNRLCLTCAVRLDVGPTRRREPGPAA